MLLPLTWTMNENGNWEDHFFFQLQFFSLHVGESEGNS